MEDEEKIKQFCGIPSEIIEGARNRVKKVYGLFYEALRLSKKDHEERCRIETVGKNKLNDKNKQI